MRYPAFAFVGKPPRPLLTAATRSSRSSHFVVLPSFPPDIPQTIAQNCGRLPCPHLVAELFASLREGGGFCEAKDEGSPRKRGSYKKYRTYHQSLICAGSYRTFDDASRVDTGILPSPFGSEQSGVGCRKPSKTI